LAAISQPEQLRPCRDKATGCTARASIPGEIKVSFFNTASRPVLGISKIPVQRVLVALPLGLKRLGSERARSVTSYECMDLYHYCSIRPHAIVLQQDASPLLSSRLTAEAQAALKKKKKSNDNISFENILERTGLLTFSLWY